MANSVFRKESVDRASSPEQLNDYIRVSNVKAWLVVAATLILLLSVFIWSVVGRLETVISITGVSDGEKIICYIDDPSLLGEIDGEAENGVTAEFRTADGELRTGTIDAISLSAASRQAIEQKYDEYTAYKLGLSEWSYEVTVSADDEGVLAEGIVELNLIIDSVRPISFIWN